MKRRIGKIFVTREFSNDEELRKAFSLVQFFPLRVEYIYHKNFFEMVGMCPLFDDIEEGYETPEYDVVFREQEDGKIKVEVNLKK